MKLSLLINYHLRVILLEQIIELHLVEGIYYLYFQKIQFINYNAT